MATGFSGGNFEVEVETNVEEHVNYPGEPDSVLCVVELVNDDKTDRTVAQEKSRLLESRNFHNTDSWTMVCVQPSGERVVMVDELPLNEYLPHLLNGRLEFQQSHTD
ncbi:unnamed protein product [Lymnaea stagnalis]|uniref:Uncharacterized protein n=1 Tax=Lymnaea stagnalis TaxID=6523 RepID=A0AAV2IJU4_LYMST